MIDEIQKQKSGNLKIISVILYPCFLYTLGRHLVAYFSDKASYIPLISTYLSSLGLSSSLVVHFK